MSFDIIIAVNVPYGDLNSRSYTAPKSEGTENEPRHIKITLDSPDKIATCLTCTKKVCKGNCFQSEYNKTRYRRRADYYKARRIAEREGKKKDVQGD